MISKRTVHADFVSRMDDFAHKHNSTHAFPTKTQTLENDQIIERILKCWKDEIMTMCLCVTFSPLPISSSSLAFCFIPSGPKLSTFWETKLSPC